MKTLKDYINESFLVEAKTITDYDSPDFDEFLAYIKQYEKSLRISSPEKQRYDKKGTPITKEIAQDLLSKRLYNNISVRYDVTPEFFLDVCQKYDIKINMSNLGFGKDDVISWGVNTSKKKVDVKSVAKEIYWDDDEIVLGDKTIGYRHGKDGAGLEFFDEYKEYAEEVLKVFKRKYKGPNWYIVK